MWGSVLTEANTLNNFNFGFSTYKSDILLHLSQWQYWWWFWFSLFWTVYFFLVIRVLNKRTFSFNPTLNTSVRGHGKWGDFLVALIPLSWCGNILVNSNFILRMIEWQNESSLFTIRVQGKQWYWVYKFDASAAQNILAAPKNIGHNRWFVTTPTESYCADTYYQALHLGTQLEFKSLYYKYLDNDGLTRDNLNNNSLQTNNEILSKFDLIKNTQNNSVNINKILTKKFVLYRHYLKPILKKKLKTLIYKSILFNQLKNTKCYGIDFLNYNLDFLNLIKKNLNSSVNSKSIYNLSYYDYEQLDDLSNFAANIAQQQNNKPIIFLRGILNKHNYSILRKSNINFLKKPRFMPFYKSINILRRKVKLLNTNYTSSIRRSKYDLLTYKLKIAEKQLKYRPIKDVMRNIKIRMNDPWLEKKHQIRISRIWNKYLSNKKRNIFLKKHLVMVKLKSLYKDNFLNLRSFWTFKKRNRVLFLNKQILFNIQFGNNSTLVDKVEDSELLWGFRQKKYKRFKKYFFNKGFTYDSKTLNLKKQQKPTLRQLKNTLTDVPGRIKEVGFIENYVTPIEYNYEGGVLDNYHKSIKYNKHKNELVPVNLARRLLRVKRTLVLPAHVNITLISNSYDVVHSWFIPGLGLKIDCVPGRSTHHTFYIDNIGFYYGQCAEICGRYHHHMPIRLCALSFEHFLVWWQKKGLKRLHRFNSLKNK